eukprot:5951586-Amphidinium_carterae.1
MREVPEGRANHSSLVAGGVMSWLGTSQDSPEDGAGVEVASMGANLNVIATAVELCKVWYPEHFLLRSRSACAIRISTIRLFFTESRWYVWSLW